MYESCSCFKYLSALHIDSTFLFSCSNKYVNNCIYSCFNLHFSNVLWYCLFTCLFYILILSLWNVFKSFPFFKVVLFSYHWIWVCFTYSGYKSFVGVCSFQIYPPSPYLVSSFSQYLWKNKSFKFMKSSLFDFYIDKLFGVIPKNSWPNPRSQD